MATMLRFFSLVALFMVIGAAMIGPATAAELERVTFYVA